MLNPVHDHTVPMIKPKRRVLGLEVSQFTARPLIPIEPKNAGTRPMGASRMNLRTVPMTISGVTIPRNIIDLTIDAARPLWRSRDSERRVHIVRRHGPAVHVR